MEDDELAENLNDSLKVSSENQEELQHQTEVPAADRAVPTDLVHSTAKSPNRDNASAHHIENHTEACLQNTEAVVSRTKSTNENSDSEMVGDTQSSAQPLQQIDKDMRVFTKFWAERSGDISYPETPSMQQQASEDNDFETVISKYKKKKLKKKNSAEKGKDTTGMQIKGKRGNIISEIKLHNCNDYSVLEC